MIDLNALSGAADLLLAGWQAWLVVPLGLIIGIVFGMLPGLSVPIAMAVFLPMTLYMEFVPAILFLTSIFTGGGFGGAVPAILMNVPGTTAAVATCFDGYPMARRGQHNEALGIALAASTVGTAIGYILLLLLLEPISQAVLLLGPPELFMIALWGLTLIAALSEGSFWRGVLVGCVGLLAGTIGMSSRGTMRGTFDSAYLLDGIPVVSALIGLFAASELFVLIRSSYIVEDEAAREVRFSKLFAGFFLGLRNWPMILRGSLIGTSIGTVPGVGSTVANLVSYSIARNRDPDKESYGKGNPKGVVAAESANSSSEGGSMATLLALGLPGGAGTAIMLGAFAMHNVTGGPRFISDHKDIVYAIIAGNLVQAVLLIGIGMVFLRLSLMIVKVPLRILIPTILALTILGSYALSGNMTGPIAVVAGAIIGWFLKQNGFPVVALVIGLLLGGMAEGELLRSYQLGGSSLGIFLERPIALGILAVMMLSALWPHIAKRLFAPGRLPGTKERLSDV
ncbi:tripartite tricarboxylate transporter permease (plasmid) [Skermanella mucosa]|uniref:tripartite tricarboxylate transporter permease n=1 Tax=Skermanella mucosa TaxID=1789672 RepID=UPI00192B5081|nr:tripartite tricarboxylate transporter permease [Skermanella mucosa]UEM24421.1 tripartite tricarboxylate transporter permease [Skermanella mucosa]